MTNLVTPSTAPFHENTRLDADTSRSFRLSAFWPIVALLGTLYGSLLPFSISLSAFTFDNAFGLMNIQPHSATPEDLITNIVVYIPAGLLLVLSQPRNRRNSLRTLIGCILVGGCVSLLAETLQTGIAIRVASYTDIALNLFGTAAGAGTALAVQSRAPSIVRRVRHTLNTTPMTSLGIALTIGLVVFHLAPFDFASNPAQWRTSLSNATLSLTTPDAQDVIHALWFTFLGYMMLLAALETGNTRTQSTAQAAIGGFALVVVIESLQLFSNRHAFTITDILIRTIAHLIGCIGATFIATNRTPQQWIASPRLALPTPLLVSLIAVQIVAIVFATDQIPRALHIPFETLWRGPMILAAFELTTTSVQYATLAACLTIVLRRQRVTSVWLIVALCVIACSSMATIAPYVLASSSVDLTSPVIATLAAILVAQFYPIIRPQQAPIPH